MGTRRGCQCAGKSRPLRRELGFKRATPAGLSQSWSRQFAEAQGRSLGQGQQPLLECSQLHAGSTRVHKLLSWSQGGSKIKTDAKEIRTGTYSEQWVAPATPDWVRLERLRLGIRPVPERKLSQGAQSPRWTELAESIARRQAALAKSRGN